MGFTNEGLTHVLDVAVHDATKVATWYIGLIDAAGFIVLAAGDTIGAHAGWAESTAYSEATRREWQESAAGSQEAPTATEAEFTMTGAVTIKGFFLVSDSTKGGATGTLLLTKLFDDGDRTFAAGEKCKVALTITASDATL